MQEELKRNNTIGDLRGILHFTKVVLASESIKRETARQMCLFLDDLRINFNAAVAFFEYLELIFIKDQMIFVTEAGMALYHIQDNFEEQLCAQCLRKLMASNIIDDTSLHFNTQKKQYCIKKYGFPFSAAIFRNFLIQLGALHEQTDGSLIIDVKFESIFAKLQQERRKKITIAQLKKKLEEQSIQGEKAEEFVIKYEQIRIPCEELNKQIRQISLVDVCAGYDIVSFENSSSLCYDRFIEVKSYKGVPHFYWSKNEIDVATLLGKKYYIYLVDIDKIHCDGYEPTIIPNARESILKNDSWLMQAESFYVFKI